MRSIHEVITMPPAGIDNSVQGTNVLWDLLESNPEMQKEYENYKIIIPILRSARVYLRISSSIEFCKMWSNAECHDLLHASISF